MIALMLAAILPGEHTGSVKSDGDGATASGAITAKPTSADQVLRRPRDLAVPDDVPLPLDGFKPWLAADIDNAEECRPEDADGKPGHTQRST